LQDLKPVKQSKAIDSSTRPSLVQISWKWRRAKIKSNDTESSTGPL